MPGRRETSTVPRPATSHFADPKLEQVVGHIYKHLYNPAEAQATIQQEITTIVEETVPAEHPQFYDRGDPATVDWDEGDLTLNGSWRDLDLTAVNASIAGATLVLLRVGAYTFAGNARTISFRTNGNSNSSNVASLTTDYVAGDGQEVVDLLVVPDENGVIEYNGVANLASVSITVAGWWSGYGTEGGGASSEIALNSSHRLGDGSDHADVASNSADIITNAAAIALNTTHRTSNGSDHSYLNQSVTTTADVTFNSLTLTDYLDGPEVSNVRQQAAVPPGPTYRRYSNVNASDATNRIDTAWRMNNDAEDLTEFLMMRVQANDITDGSEDSYARFFTFEAGVQDWTLGWIGYQTRVHHDLRVQEELILDSDLDHDGTKIGFFGKAPAVRAAAYTTSNVTTDRTFDADTVAVAELADVVGTLIADLKTYGLLQ